MDFDPLKELERFKGICESVFSMGRRSAAIVGLHKHGNLLLSVVARHIDLSEEKASTALSFAISEAAATIPIYKPNIVTLALPKKMGALNGLQVLVVERGEVAVRNLSYTFTDDDRFGAWSDMPPEDSPPADSFYVSLITSLMRQDQSQAEMPEVLFTTLSKRGHQVYISDEQLSDRWRLASV